ncbi:MAG: divergent PAP2 family protein [Clostridia bacterium]|nr:divergent PAP2 family protein [Clostridia bacterium]
MEYIKALFTNRMFVTPLLAWLTAQLIKVIIHLLVHKEFSPERLFGDGGMPSGHSATVIAMTTTAAIVYGLGSPVFAISAVLAVIVMNDAVGVRRETGRHAKRINAIWDRLFSTEISDVEKLKVFVGHSPFQVIIGASLGLIMALIINLLF